MTILPGPDRDEAVEMCLEMLATGRVHGLPEGTGYVENVTGDFGMVRDWGLVEAHYGRADPAAPWECRFLMIQAHRMAEPPAWAELAAPLVERGHEFVAGPFFTEYAEYHSVVASNSHACVDTDVERYRGRAVKISNSEEPVPSPPAPLPYRELRQALREVAGAGEASWPGWLERRRPDPAQWCWLPRVLRTLCRDEPERAGRWVAFGGWLLEQAREAGVWPADEWTWRWATFVRECAAPVPAGEVARACREAVPMSAAEVAALPASWREIAPADVRRYRMSLALRRLAGTAA